MVQNRNWLAVLRQNFIAMPRNLEAHSKRHQKSLAALKIKIATLLAAHNTTRPREILGIIGTLPQHYNNIVGSHPTREISMEVLKHEEEQLSYRSSFGKHEEKTETSLHGKRGNLEKREHFTGAWTRVEQIAYFRFIINSQQIMDDTKLRKRCRIFKRMAGAIGTRGTIQCKSHHQKMMITNRNDFRRLITFGKANYLSENALQLVGNLEKENAQYASNNFFYRIFTRGPCIKIVINEACIKSYP